MSDITTVEKEVIGNAIPYEIWMLQQVHCRLISGGIGDTVLNNALIESFCIYARALIDMLSNQQGAKARDYTTEAFDELSESALRTSLKTKLNTQVAHITGKRTSDQSKKINGDDRALLLRVINAKMAQFRDCLKPELQSFWNTRNLPIPLPSFLGQ